MDHCGKCCGNCGGCGRQMVLTEWEMEMLNRLGQIPFLPVARRADSMTPIFLEDERHTVEEYGLILECLEKKGLISLDYQKQIKGFDDSKYRAYPICGSIALTERGQNVLELMELQGVQQM